jgi:membrane protein DedA with SNARE-associated domain
MNIITSLLNNLNYGTIFFLMLLESTVIPVPSELVVSPAAYHAAAGNLDIFLVILFATIGADVGASINYFAGYYLGRPIIYRFANSKWGKMCLLNQQKVEKSEKYFYDHGMVATLTGRLLPGIRHLISIAIANAHTVS